MEEELAQGVSYLITRGHSLKEVLGYSFRQMNAFIELANKEERKAQSAIVWCARVAYHADGKEYSNIIKELDK